MILRYVIGAATLTAALSTTAAMAQSTRSPYSTFYVFGDSLVDAGNIDALTGIPDETQGYFDGRFTNGYNYPDLLSQQLFGAPTVASLDGGNNYAFGGARVLDTGDFPPDLAAQLGAYSMASGGVADPNALYILNLGGNDIFGLLTGRIGAFETSENYIDTLVETYAAGVTFLDAIGARNILITGIPNATETISFGIEAQLLAELDVLDAGVLDDETTLLRYSYLSFFTRLQTNPGSLGLPPLRTDTTCLRARTPSPTIDCTGFFRFDDVHPTAAVQAALARDIDRQFGITAVPEPETWAMMIGGFGLTGAMLRRRRAQAIAVA